MDDATIGLILWPDGWPPRAPPYAKAVARSLSRGICLSIVYTRWTRFFFVFVVVGNGIGRTEERRNEMGMGMGMDGSVGEIRGHAILNSLTVSRTVRLKHLLFLMQENIDLILN